MRLKIVVIYMDDIVIVANGVEEALERLRMVPEVARHHGLNINWVKYRFVQHEIECLGHIVTKNTIRLLERKILAVRNFPKPTNVKQVQSLLGLTGYFRKFIKGYSTIPRPLTNIKKRYEVRIRSPQDGNVRSIKIGVSK